MDAALSRLNACPGKRDLSMDQAADVLEVSMRTIRRMTKPDARGQTAIGCRITGHMRRSERYKKYGHGHRVLIPRVDVVLYLARHHTKPADFLLSLTAQCPEYVPAVKAALSTSGPAAPAVLPENVIPMNAPRRATKSTPPEHPGQMLFPFPSLASA